MRIPALVAAMAALSPFASHADAAGDLGWLIGDAIGGGATQRAEERGTRKGLEMAALQAEIYSLQMDRARQKQMAERAELTKWWQEKLIGWWQAAGASPQEAERFASSFRLHDDFSVIIETARPKGSDRISADIRRALDSYDFQLANDLLYALVLANRDAIDQGRAELNALDAQLMATDTEYPAKRAALIDMLKPTLATLPSTQWAPAYKAAYEKLTAGKAALQR